MPTQLPSKRWSKKNHDRLALVEAKKDCGKEIARGSLAKRMRFSGPTPTIHLSKNIGNPHLPVSYVTVSRMPWTMPMCIKSQKQTKLAYWKSRIFSCCRRLPS